MIGDGGRAGFTVTMQPPKAKYASRIDRMLDAAFIDQMLNLGLRPPKHQRISPAERMMHRVREARKAAKQK